MRFIVLLLFTWVFCLPAKSQVSSAQQMSAKLQQTISMLENQLTDAKINHASAATIKQLTDQIKSIKSALATVSQGGGELEKKTKSNADPGPKWTGHLTAVKKSSSSVPVSSGEAEILLNFTDAIPTLHRDFNENEELNFTDDKGTGTVKEHGAITIGTETHTCDCTGNGAAELHEVVVDLLDSTYSIQAFAPPCKGGDGQDCGVTFDFSVADQPLTNAKVLTGTLTQETEVAGIKSTVTSTWNLVRSVDVELIVTPEGYENWMPVPGEDENTAGSNININMKLQGKNGKPLTHKAVRFELQLMQTSREPGTTINFPKHPKENLPDIRFLPKANATIEDEEQRMKLKCDKCTTGSFALGSYDGGGWTTIIAVAVLEDSSRLKGNLLVSGGPVEIPIPKRNPGSVIAMKWANENGNPNDMDDDEKSDDNKNPGDGFTAYEEYRGVMTEGEYKRLNPKRKELGVQVKRSELSLFAEGLEWFKAASDIDIVRFYLYETLDRRVNFNANHAHDYNQYALKLDKGSLPNNTAGKAFTATPEPDIPANTKQVVIAPNNIHRNYQNWSGWAHANNLQLLWTEQEYIAQTVAHEISHGVNVWHHGDADGLTHQTAKKDGTPIYHIFDRSSNEITTRDFTVATNDRICAQGKQSSGDLSCIMAYIDVCDWVQINYKDGSIGLFQSPLLPIGRNLCKNKQGTSINEGSHTVSGVAYENYFGKATNGECKNKIKLR